MRVWAKLWSVAPLDSLWRVLVCWRLWGTWCLAKPIAGKAEVLRCCCRLEDMRGLFGRTGDDVKEMPLFATADLALWR